jgi:nucleoid-associated protein Lsr2
MLIDNASLEANETVRFGVDGRTYEIDLPAGRAGELRSMADRYIRVARQIRSAPSRAQQPRLPAHRDQEQPPPSMPAADAGARGGGHGLTDGERQELRTIAEAARPRRDIVASRLRTKGLADRDTAGNWWLTDAGRRELT